MNHPKMLLLAGRLVVAMESMAQDVKSMATYVKDISCSVSYLLNEKREKEGTFDVGDDTTSFMSGQYEQADGSSSVYFGDQVYKEISIEEITPKSIDPLGNSDILSSEDISIFSEGIKIEEPPEDQVYNEIHDLHNMYGSCKNNAKVLKETISEKPLEFEEDQPHKLHTTISHSPPDLLESIELASVHIRKEIQQVVTSSNSAVNTDHPTFLSSFREGLRSVAGISQMTNAMGSSAVHSRVHSKGKSYKCLMREKSFKSPSGLKRHTRVHSGERPYKCNICGDAFAQSGHLTQHICSHTGERPYRCNVCGRTFLLNGNLTTHMRLHRGEKPYKCNLCEKAFRHSQRLNQHMSLHH